MDWGGCKYDPRSEDFGFPEEIREIEKFYAKYPRISSFVRRMKDSSSIWGNRVSAYRNENDINEISEDDDRDKIMAESLFSADFSAINSRQLLSIVNRCKPQDIQSYLFRNIVQESCISVNEFHLKTIKGIYESRFGKADHSVASALAHLWITKGRICETASMIAEIDGNLPKSAKQSLKGCLSFKQAIKLLDIIFGFLPDDDPTGPGPRPRRRMVKSLSDKLDARIQRLLSYMSAKRLWTSPYSGILESIQTPNFLEPGCSLNSPVDESIPLRVINVESLSLTRLITARPDIPVGLLVSHQSKELLSAFSIFRYDKDGNANDANRITCELEQSNMSDKAIVPSRQDANLQQGEGWSKWLGILCKQLQQIRPIMRINEYQESDDLLILHRLSRCSERVLCIDAERELWSRWVEAIVLRLSDSIDSDGNIYDAHPSSPSARRRCYARLFDWLILRRTSLRMNDSVDYADWITQHRLPLLSDRLFGRDEENEFCLRRLELAFLRLTDFVDSDDRPNHLSMFREDEVAGPEKRLLCFRWAGLSDPRLSDFMDSVCPSDVSPAIDRESCITWEIHGENDSNDSYKYDGHGNMVCRQTDRDWIVTMAIDGENGFNDSYDYDAYDHRNRCLIEVDEKLN